MDRSTVALFAVGLALLTGGGWFVYDTQIACGDCEHADYANDLALENQRAAPVDVSLTVRRDNDTTVATANETVPADDTVVTTDLAPYGTYDLTVRQGDETLQVKWEARDCYFHAVVATEDGLDLVVEAC